MNLFPLYGLADAGSRRFFSPLALIEKIHPQHPIRMTASGFYDGDVHDGHPVLTRPFLFHWRTRR